MLRTLCAAVVLAGSVAGVAVAQVPLDPTGQVTGYVPPSQGTLKCERYMNKRAALATNCIIKCNDKLVEAVFESAAFDDAACQDTDNQSCKAKYNKGRSLLAPGLCPACLDDPAQVALFDNYEAFADTLTALIYCAPGTGLPPPNGGFAPPQVDTLKCEQKLSRNVTKLIKCITLTCHRKLADDAWAERPPVSTLQCELTDTEKSCFARFNSDNAKLTGCPACLGAAALNTLFNTVRDGIDSRTGLQYCGF